MTEERSVAMKAVKVDVSGLTLTRREVLQQPRISTMFQNYRARLKVIQSRITVMRFLLPLKEDLRGLLSLILCPLMEEPI